MKDFRAPTLSSVGAFFACSRLKAPFRFAQTLLLPPLFGSQSSSPPIYPMNHPNYCQSRGYREAPLSSEQSYDVPTSVAHCLDLLSIYAILEKRFDSEKSNLFEVLTLTAHAWQTPVISFNKSSEYFFSANDCGNSSTTLYATHAMKRNSYKIQHPPFLLGCK